MRLSRNKRSIEHRHHVFVARLRKAIAKARQPLKAVFTLWLVQMLDLPMDDCGLHAVRREYRQNIAVGPLRVDLRRSISSEGKHPRTLSNVMQSTLSSLIIVSRPGMRSECLEITSR
jgi:hypothetical protein